MIQRELDNEVAFFTVFGYLPLLKYIVSFQHGRKWDDINDTEWICQHGHLSLLIANISTLTISTYYGFGC